MTSRIYHKSNGSKVEEGDMVEFNQDSIPHDEYVEPSSNQEPKAVQQIPDYASLIKVLQELKDNYNGPIGDFTRAVLDIAIPINMPFTTHRPAPHPPINPLIPNTNNYTQSYILNHDTLEGMIQNVVDSISDRRSKPFNNLTEISGIMPNSYMPKDPKMLEEYITNNTPNAEDTIYNSSNSGSLSEKMTEIIKSYNGEIKTILGKKYLKKICGKVA
jgi:hypothetical protein